jgi:hypothetical protein
MKEKKCFKCEEEKPLTEFYRHKQMADGYLNKCKECVKTYVRGYYRLHEEERKHYERERNKTPERKLQRAEYQRTRRLNHREKCRANDAVGKAKLKGRLVPEPCEVCGTTENVEAHHPDYSKPLDVQWLCFTHHRELHYAMREDN